MPGLDQKATARHLRKAGTHDEVEEVLAAYLHSCVALPAFSSLLRH